MMAIELQLPIEEPDILSTQDTGEGTSRITMLIKDANQRLFSLNVVTEESFEQQLRDEADIPGEVEPAFIIPAKSLTTDMVDAVLKIPRELLEQYLVPQDTRD